MECRLLCIPSYYTVFIDFWGDLSVQDNLSDMRSVTVHEISYLMRSPRRFTAQSDEVVDSRLVLHAEYFKDLVTPMEKVTAGSISVSS